MNPGHTIFKRAQRLQRGTEKLEPGPLPYDKIPHGFKTRAGIYDPGSGTPEQERTASNEATMTERQKAREATHSTIGMHIGDREWEVPTTWDEMPDDIMWWVHNQPQDQWPDRVKDAIEDNARDLLEQGIDPLTGYKVDDPRNQDERDLATPTPAPQYAHGTSNVGSGIFKNAQRMQGGMQVVNRLGYDPSKPTRGFGSGEPTRRGIDIGVSGAANVFLPGFGWIAGKIARGLWHTIQNMQMNGASKQQIQQVVQQAQEQEQEQPETPTAPAPPTTPATPSAGVGIDPWGNPADPGEWWSNDFGRWITDQYGTTPGDYNLRGPGGQFGTRGLNFSAQSNIGGSGTVGNFATAIGFDGPFGGGISAGDTSRFRGQAGYSHPYTEAQYNASTSTHGTGQGPGYQLGPGWTPRASYEQYVAGFHAPGTVGSSTGPGGAAVGGTGGPQGGMKQFIGHTPRRAAFAMGESDVSPYERAGSWATKFLPLESSDWRKSGVAKGPGFLGPLRRPDGQTSTELSVGVGTDEGETEIPSLVPGLTKEEVDYLLLGGRPTKSIIDKAISHARLRKGAGRDPFYEYGESPSPLRYAMGTSDVNPGLKLFHRTQLRRPKQ